MKQIIALTAATFLASSGLAFAQEEGNNGMSGIGNGAPESGASDFAPGHMKSEGESARDYAPGQMKSEGESASEFAPGQRAAEQDGIDDETTASTGGEADRAVTLIESGDFNLGSVSPEANVSVVSLSDLSEEDRQELQEAISANQESIESLREELASLQIEGLDQAEINSAVAADASADGELTVYVE